MWILLWDYFDNFRQSFESNETPGFKLFWSFFYDDLLPTPRAENVSKAFHILRHTRKVKKKTLNLWKTFYDTEKVVAVFSHDAFLFTDVKW